MGTGNDIGMPEIAHFALAPPPGPYEARLL
jgi:hypothetical protein